MTDETKKTTDDLGPASSVDLQEAEDREDPTPAPSQPASTSSYFEKVVRFIPAALNAAYVTSLGLLAESAPNPAWLHWAVFLSLWVLVPFYVLYIPGQLQDKSVSKRFCVMAGVISFAVWVFAVDGGPVAISFPGYYKPLYGSLLLIITTLILPVLEIVLKKFSYFKPEEEL